METRVQPSLCVRAHYISPAPIQSPVIAPSSLPPAISKTRFSKHGPAARIGYIDLGMILDDAAIEVFMQGRELRPAHSNAHAGLGLCGLLTISDLRS